MLGWRAFSRITLRQMDRVYLYFGLGKAYEDRRDTTWHFRITPAVIKLSGLNRDISHNLHVRRIRRTKRVFSAIEPSRDGFEAPDPIFIVGMPRAGSTLLEQILSSHSQVDGTQKLPNILSAVHQLRSRNKDFDRLNYPRAIADLSAGELRGNLGETILKRPARIDKRHLFSLIRCRTTSVT